jgi:serine/threonine protein kinase/Tfp pilus assembly protein PilF
MNSVDWPRLEQLFHAASQLPTSERATYLEHECRDDAELHRQLESLIAESEDDNNFLDQIIDQPALNLGMQVLATNLTGSLAGQQILHYKLIKLLGQGGMGEVYLAEDCLLERQVALKFISHALVDDDWAREQLMREARAVAKLENPNICTVHGIEETPDHNFIVMQYVEGDTLAAMLRDGPLELGQALDVAGQISEALAVAHRHGIIHRDVKPQNIVVTADGQVKVLDFGLAKFVQKQPEIEVTNRPLEQTSPLGLVVGTVAYMSPEQARGEVLDFRTDIYSFGIVFYELLAGQNPFLRETRPETITAIDNDQPSPLTDLPEESREALTKIALKCLEKERARRFETTDQLSEAIQIERKKYIGRPDPAALLVRQLQRLRRLRRYALAAAVLVVLVLVGAGFIDSKLHTVHTLALFPIKNKSTDPNLDYLGEGLTRNLTDKFSYLPRLKVKLPTVGDPSGVDKVEVMRLGRELKVEAVLSGEIVKTGSALLLHLKMLSTKDGSPAWEQDFNLQETDLFALQNDITGRVTSSLGLWLIGSDKKLLTKRQTDNQEALSAYMRGRYFWSLKRDRDNIQTAIKYFEQAVALDPAFAKAYSGLADCYVLMSNVLYGPLPTREAMEKASYDARQAIEIDPSLAEAHVSMGNIKLRYEWDWQQAEREFRLAIDLNPEYAPAHYSYTSLLVTRGRFDEALQESEVARSLDPYSRLSQMNYGRTLYYSRRFADAAAHFDKLLKNDPDYAQYLHMMGLILIQQRDYLGAVKILEKLHAQDQLHTAAALGYAYGKAGKPADARRMIEELDQFSKQRPIPPFEKALVYIGLGDKDAAFQLLETAYQDKFANLIFLNADAIYDDLRSDPRFANLVHRIGLTG